MLGIDIASMRSELVELKQENGKLKEAVLKLSGENERLKEEIYGMSYVYRI